MTTTLIILGGSAASVGTGQGCSGTLVSTGTTTIVLDLGPGTLLELRKHTDFRTLDAVVISHMHVDHMLDLIALRFALAYNPVKAERKVPLWLPPGGIDFCQRLGDLLDAGAESDPFFGLVFDLNEYDPEHELRLGDLTVRFAPTVHFIPCWAMRVHPDEDQGDLFYTADTGPAADLGACADGARIVLAEATTPMPPTGEHARRGHITIDEAIDIANAAGASSLVLTHMFEENNPDASLARARSRFKGEVVLAQPGTTVSWP